MKLSRTAEDLTVSSGMLLMEEGQDKFGGKGKKERSYQIIINWTGDTG